MFVAGIAVGHSAQGDWCASMLEIIFPLAFFLSLAMVPCLIIGRLALAIIRLVNSTWLDKKLRPGERSPEEQAALLDWEASIRDFHYRQLPQCFPPERAKRQPEMGVQTNGPSAFQEQRRRF
jgi:hypothetical protein